MKTITQEIAEFRDAITTYDPANLGASIRRLVDEGFDVVGKVVNLDDDPANLTELADAVTDALGDFIAKALADRPLVKRGAQMAIPLAVPAVVQEAAKYTGTAEQFWDEKVEPILREVEATIHGIRVDMMGGE